MVSVIKAEAPKLPGSVFIFEVWLGDEYKLVHGLGEVVWVRMEQEARDRPAGMGIRFLKSDDESQAVIERVIAEQVGRGGQVFDLERPPAPVEGGDEGWTSLDSVKAIPGPPGHPEQLSIDNDLLGFDSTDTLSGDSRQPVALSIAATPTPTRRGLRVAFLMLVLATVLGGAAYLISARLLPF